LILQLAKPREEIFFKGMEIWLFLEQAKKRSATDIDMRVLEL